MIFTYCPFQTNAGGFWCAAKLVSLTLPEFSKIKTGTLPEFSKILAGTLLEFSKIYAETKVLFFFLTLKPELSKSSSFFFSFSVLPANYNHAVMLHTFWQKLEKRNEAKKKRKTTKDGSVPHEHVPLLLKKKSRHGTNKFDTTVEVSSVVNAFTFLDHFSIWGSR